MLPVLRLREWPLMRTQIMRADALWRGYALMGLALVLVYAAHASGALTAIDAGLSAWRAHTLARAPTGQVVVVEIDTASLRAAGEWPWSRARFGEAVSELAHAGADIIALDVDFSLRADGDGDRALRAALEAHPTNVALPAFVQPDGDLNTPLQTLSTNARLASVNIPIDADGRARRYAMGHDVGGAIMPTLAALSAGRSASTEQFLIDYGLRAAQIDRMSFEEARSGAFDPARVRGRIVLVGATALELGDEFATPAHAGLPGVYVHALATESLLQNRALMGLAPSAQLALAFGIIFLLWPRRRESSQRQFVLRHCIALALCLGGPFALQAFAPLSFDLALCLFAQTLCLAAALMGAFARRAEDAMRAREAGLREAALHDLETNLPNRRALLERLDSSPLDSPVILTIGVERLATLRAAIGLARTNRALIQLARRLEHMGFGDAFRLSNSVLGFVVQAAVDVDRIETHHGVTIDDQDIDLDIRIGYAKRLAGEGVDKTLEHAIAALSHARVAKLRACEFHPELLGDPQLQWVLTSDVTRALGRGDFSLFYQPKAHARNGAVLGLEALLRWRHPELGEIAPAAFIPVAEETGAIGDLTDFVIAQALRDQRALRRAGVNIPISVNVSGRLLGSAAYCESMIDKMSLMSDHFCVEITETAVISDPQAAMSALAAFRAAGIQVSIDDYGAGLSSLAYLKRLAADELKLDRALVVDAATSKRDRLILKSTIDLAHGLGMQVVAEGVEDQTTRAVLATMGCDAIQGYLIMRPVPLASILEAFAQNSLARAG